MPIITSELYDYKISMKHYIKQIHIVLLTFNALFILNAQTHIADTTSFKSPDFIIMGGIAGVYPGIILHKLI